MDFANLKICWIYYLLYDEFIKPKKQRISYCSKYI